MGKEELPSCRFRCWNCPNPDCTYDGDYVTSKEKAASTKQDMRARWYRKTWKQIKHEKNDKERKAIIRYAEKAERMNRTENGNIDLSITEAYKFLAMGYILVIENGEITEIHKE